METLIKNTWISAQIGKRTIGFILLLFIVAISVHAQMQDSTLTKDSVHKKIKVYPVITYSPETRLGLGLTAFKLFIPGHESRTSNITATALYTLNNQIIIEGGTTTFFDREKWLVKGKVNFKKFLEKYYGIGENTSDNPVQINYSYYNINGALFRNFYRGEFIGIQSTCNRYFNINTNDSNQPADTLTNLKDCTNIGFGGIYLHDTRNNVLNSSKGSYMEFSFMIQSKKWGSQYDYNALKLDLRKFFPISSKEVIAVQFLGLAKTGDVPFLQLSYLGGSDIMRGMYAGRYRDKDLMAAQVEYRRQLTHNWGAVAFAGIGNVSDKISNYNFGNMKTTFGLGARRMLDKKERVNLRIDAGYGDNQINFYITIAEAF